MLYVRRTLGRDRGNSIQFEATASTARPQADTTTSTYETERERPTIM